MATQMIFELIKQFFRKPATNKFPLKYIPKSINNALRKISIGKIKINPPIETPKNFRGRIKYDKEKCIGCGLCIKVCPSKAIEMKEKEKKIRIFVARCTFCAQCTEVCPVKALSMSNEFLLAEYDKFSKKLIVE